MSGVTDPSKYTAKSMADEMDSTAEMTEEELNSAFTSAAVGDQESAAKEVPEDDHAEQTEPEDLGQPDSEPAEGEVEQESEQPADEGEGSASNLESLLQTAADYGISTEGIKSEAELSERVLTQVRRMQEIIRERRQEAAKPEGPAPAQQDQPKDWTLEDHLRGKYGGPEWKPEYEKAINSGLVQMNEDTGLWMAKPGFEMAGEAIAAEINAAEQHAAQFWRGMTRGNPFDQIYQALSEPIERMIQDRVQQQLASSQAQAKQQDAIDRFEQENDSWLYQTDPDTGQRVLSEQGRRFTDTISGLAQDGIKDPARLIQYAQQMTGLGLKQDQPASQPASPAQQTTAPVAAKPAAKAVSQESQQQAFLENARRANHSPSARGRVSEDAPQVMSQGDLESYFIRAAKASSAN